MSSYVPPFRRAQAEGVSPDTTTTDLPPAAPSSHNRPYNNRGRGRGSRAFRGFRGGGGRGNRGGSGGYQAIQDPPIDEADLYHPRDLANHFAPGKEEDDWYRHSSTFHDSTARPGQLSYVILYHGANPRWSNDHIVFAKSHLDFLPEYAAKMLEHGPWDIQPTETVSNSPDNSQDTEEPATDETTSGKAGDATIDGTNPGVEQPSSQDITSPLNQAAPESSLASTDGKSSDGLARDDATKDDNASAAASTFATSSSSRMKYTDVRNIPPEELHDREENDEPSLPSIPPIDYAPSAHTPIAVFEQRRVRGPHGGAGSDTKFAFAGWYKVARVNVLAPRSTELVRMQKQKWERRDRFGRTILGRARDASAWETAVSIEWAVVKFEKLGAGEAPPAPAVERLPAPQRRSHGDEGEPRSVNEMLTELRLQGTNTEEPVQPDGYGGDGKAGAREEPGGAPEGEAQKPVGVQGKENTPTA